MSTEWHQHEAEKKSYAITTGILTAGVLALAAAPILLKSFTSHPGEELLQNSITAVDASIAGLRSQIKQIAKTEDISQCELQYSITRPKWCLQKEIVKIPISGDNGPQPGLVILPSSLDCELDVKQSIEAYYASVLHCLNNQDGVMEDTNFEKTEE